MIKIFITGVPIVIFLMAIPYIILSTADGKVFMAWYLHNRHEYNDWGAECSEAWVDGAQRFGMIGLVVNWVSYIISAAIAECTECSRFASTSKTREALRVPMELLQAANGGGSCCKWPTAAGNSARCAINRLRTWFAA